MRMLKILDPNERLPITSVIWYILAVGLMGVSICIALSANWQTDGLIESVYDSDNVIKEGTTVTPANGMSILPQTTSIMWATMIYGALLARRYIRNVANIPTLILVAVNIFFMASLIESFVPAQSICLLKCMKCELVTINPQTLLISAVLLTWIGMRALSGISIIVLGIAFISRVQDLNVSLGMYGGFFLLCGFLSLLIQAKLPYMVPECGWCASLLQDFAAIRIAAQGNVAALETVELASTITEVGVKKAPTVIRVDEKGPLKDTQRGLL